MLEWLRALSRLLLLAHLVTAVDPEESCGEDDGDAEDSSCRDGMTVDDAGQQEGNHLAKGHDNYENHWT